MELIDKSALVAEIEERLDKLYNLLPDASKVENGNITIPESCNTGRYMALESFKKFLDTIEVKQVDLDESARHYLLHEHISPLNEVLHHADLKVEMQYHKDIEDAYKAGFELGLKAKKGK